MRYLLTGLVLCSLVACQEEPTAAPSPTSTAPGPPAPAAEPTAVVRSLSLILEPIPATQGGQVRISGRGFAAAETIAIQASKDAGGAALLPLGEAVASAQGTIDPLTVKLPDDLASGPHALEAVG